MWKRSQTHPGSSLSSAGPVWVFQHVSAHCCGFSFTALVQSHHWMLTLLNLQSNKLAEKFAILTQRCHCCVHRSFCCRCWSASFSASDRFITWWGRSAQFFGSETTNKQASYVCSFFASLFNTLMHFITVLLPNTRRPPASVLSFQIPPLHPSPPLHLIPSSATHYEHQSRSIVPLPDWLSLNPVTCNLPASLTSCCIQLAKWILWQRD